MNCRDSESLLLAERDGGLSKGELAALSAHVAECPSCGKFRTDIATALSAYDSGLAAVTVPDPDEAWRDLRSRLREPARRRPLAPIVWFGATLAAAAALALVLALSHPKTAAPSLEVVIAPPPAPLYDPSVIAGADFVEAGDPNASTLVYVDKESGWLVVWATDGDANTSG